MKKKSLELKLQGLGTYSSSPSLEQYRTPAFIAADILHIAFSMGDIFGKKVADLGCGNGIFAIGASLLGAREVVGIDIDENAVDVARANALEAGAEVRFAAGDVKDFAEACDTVIQNPPFGAQKANRHADVKFLSKAFEVAGVVYSIHLASTERAILKAAESFGARATPIKSYKFEMPHTYSFHTKERRSFELMLIRGVKYE